MNRPVNRTDVNVLDDSTLEALGESASAAHLDAETSRRLRNSVMDRLDKEPTNKGFFTISADGGEWQEIADRVEKKVLHCDPLTGVESYLLRIHPGADLERHYHEQAEHCLCLEGDVAFDDVRLETGDYHYAPAGSWHGPASTVNGAVLFLQAAA